MTRVPDLISVTPTASLEVVARAFAKSGSRHIPVLDDGQLMGVIHQSHLDAQGLLLDDVWTAWSDVATAAELSSAIPRVEADEADPSAQILRALLDHTCVALTDEAGGFTGFLTDTDGVELAGRLLTSDTRALDLCEEPPRTARLRTPAWAALREMERRGVRHLVVVDACEAVGVVSIRDLQGEPVKDVPGPWIESLLPEGRPHTAQVDISAPEAAATLYDLHIGCLPLINENGTFEAVVTRRDLMRAALETLVGPAELHTL